jgi:hypothetical protein
LVSLAIGDRRLARQIERRQGDGLTAGEANYSIGIE